MESRHEGIPLERAESAMRSRILSVKLFDRWVRQRQTRQDLAIPKSKEELKELGLGNFKRQLAEPRQEHLQQLKKFSSEISTADKVALLVSMELPALEISSLLHKLSAQLAKASDSPYFSKVNQNDNCGCGCGCGCAAMAGLPYEERIYAHYGTKPYSIDPFNEVGIPEAERDGLLIRDFLESYEVLSHSVTERVNQRYFRMGREFSEL